jgi:hypothetical protein
MYARSSLCLIFPRRTRQLARQLTETLEAELLCAVCGAVNARTIEKMVAEHQR